MLTRKLRALLPRRLYALPLHDVRIIAVTAWARAQTYAPTANHCVVPFYGPDMYNWLAYRNTCNAAIYVVYVSNDGHHTGSMHLGIGKHDSTGHDLDEVDSWHGFETYACPEGYTPVGPDGSS